MTRGDNKRFWDRYAKLYDFEIRRFSRHAYEQMYRFMSQSLADDMDVLEIATGTGLIALRVAGWVKSVTATDFSPQMITAAQRKSAPANVSFSVEDATSLSFEDNAFDAVIVSNALHVMPDPVLALQNIRRVLKPKGLLIAPSFSHGHISQAAWDRNVKMLKFLGFETYSKWLPEEYVRFIGCNGFEVDGWQVLNAAFPLVYLEARSNKS